VTHNSYNEFPIYAELWTILAEDIKAIEKKLDVGGGLGSAACPAGNSS